MLRGSTTIAERLAQHRDMDPEGGLFEDRVGPRPRDQLFFRNRVAGALGGSVLPQQDKRFADTRT
jgi:hypothetical protein